MMPNFRPRKGAVTNLIRVYLIFQVAVLLQGCLAAVGTGVVAGAALAYDRRTTGTLLDDELIELKVIERIASEHELWDQSHVNVTSFNNIVLVTGEAPSEAMRQRITEITSGVPKVRAVHNEMAIAAPSSILSRSSDSLITTKTVTALANTELNLVSRAKVVTENGVVYLMGLVTRDEGDGATKVARQVGGVQRVVRVFEYMD